MKQTKEIYSHRGFSITDWNAGNDFEPLQDGLKWLQI